MNDIEREPKPDIAQTLGLGGPQRLGRRGKRWLFALAALATLLAAAGAWLLARNGDSVRYETQTARRGDLTVTVSATGNLQPTNQVDVGIEVSGTIKSVDVDYNDAVKAGQVLARLDTAKLEAQMLQSKAALAAAKSKVQQAQASVLEAQAQWERLKRVQQLSGGKVPSQHELDAALAALDRAKADGAAARAAVAQTQATLDANRTDLSKAVIRSPIDGVVLKRSVEPGQTVAASFQAPVLFTIAEDLKEMELQVDVDEADVGSVKAGQDATFTVDAYPNRSFPARITKVYYGSQTVEGVVTYKAVLKVDNADLALRPGMTATAVITVKKLNDVLLAPNAALRFTPPQSPPPVSNQGGGLIGRLFPRPHRSAPPAQRAGGMSRQQRVWTLRGGQLQSIDVATGATDGVMTEITAGAVDPGTPLVTDVIAAR